MDSSIRHPRNTCCIASVTRNGGSLNLFSIVAFQAPQATPTRIQRIKITGNGSPAWDRSPEIMPIIHIIYPADKSTLSDARSRV